MSGQTNTWQAMKVDARVFLSLVVVVGASALTYGVVHWTGREPLQTFCYLLIAILASRLKVKLPGITGTMSASFLVILLSVVELGLSESLVIGCATTLAQSFSKDRPRFVQLIFNVCASAIAVLLTDRVYHLAVLGGPAGKTVSLLAAACTYFLANTLPVSTIISLTEDKSLRKTWRECYFWAFPYYLLGAGLAGLLNWLHGRINWQTSLLLLPGIYLIYRSYRLYLGKLEAEKTHAEQVAKLHLRTIEVLALAIEAKDQTTHAHLQRVRVYATEIARELRVSPDEIEALQAAALLHDIGKLAVPEHIISKPGKLTPEEFEKMKIHPGRRRRTSRKGRVPLSGRPHRSSPPRKMGWLRVSLRSKTARKSLLVRAFWPPSISWTRCPPTGNIATLLALGRRHDAVFAGVWQII